MQAIILAAGLGSRLKDLTQDKPKAMVEVAGKKLIDYAIEFISPEIPSIYVVAGYKIEIFKPYLSRYPNVFVIENKDFNKGSVLTLEKALPYIKEDFLLMNVDHIYPKKMFHKILSSIDSQKIIAMTDSDRTLVEDDMKVEINSDGTIKKISKQLTHYQLGYIGMTFIGKERIPEYRNALETVKKNTEGKANVEAILDYLAPITPIHTLDLSGMGWYEVDNQEDREKAEKLLYEKQNI